MNWFLDVVKNKYAKFDGRARRQEYWMYTLFYLIIYIVLMVVDGMIGMPVLSGLLALGLLVPSIAVTIRRLHDTGRPGWWLLIGFIPLVGLVLIYFLVIDGQPGENQYGPNPKGT
jgi:uncharacterized membrane protein YhaH (DUF805 family)